jgi:CheY-like chemotaxis protein
MVVANYPEKVDEGLCLARVLLVEDDVASRLTLQTVLRAGGYWVDVAASAAEAVEKLEVREYDLVLSGLRVESEEAGLRVLAHARSQDYRPATALIRSYHDSGMTVSGEVVVETEGMSGLLTEVAELIGLRATRRVERYLRQAAS